jgi:ATP-dependent Lon protease
MNKGEEPRSQLEPSDTEKTKRNRIAVLQEKSLSFRMGQTGASYEKLFAHISKKQMKLRLKTPIFVPRGRLETL